MFPLLKPRAKAFTLVELLVAMLVLTIMLISVASVVNSTNTATAKSYKQINADDEARAVFDRMADDFGHLVNRSDVDFALGRNTGNDALFFYSEGSALGNSAYPAPQQGTSALIGYRINGSYQLERLGKDMAVGAPPPDGMIYLTYPSPGQPPSSTPLPTAPSTFSGNAAWQPLIGSAPTYTGGTDGTYYHVLGQSVFRFEFCYLRKPVTQSDGTVANGVYSNYPNPSPGPNGGTYTYTIGLQQVQAIVVALAILDPVSRQNLVSSDLAALAACLTDPTDAALNPAAASSGSPAPSPSPAELMAQAWDAALFPAPPASANLPNLSAAAKAALPSVRIYQRTFYLGSFLR